MLKTYWRIHTNFAQRLVVHCVDILLVTLLLFPKSLENFQELILLHTAFKVDSVHGQQILDLLRTQFVEIF